MPDRRISAPPVVTADITGFFQGIATALTMVNGLWPSAMLAPGPISKITPYILFFTVAVCLGCTWRMIFHHVAREKSLAHGAGWILLAIGVWGASVGTSGRYMAALVDGATSVRDNAYAYLHDMEGVLRASENRAAADQQLIQIASSEERNLRGTQDGERRYGVVSKKAGDKGITDVIGREADAVADLTGSLRSMSDRRAGFLEQATDRLSKARDLAASGDTQGFIDATSDAVRLLKQANAISLLDAVGGFGAGMAIDAARGPFDQVKREIDEFVAGAHDKQVAVSVPVFQPMTDKEAVWTYPPVMGWIFAVMLESFPIFMVIALLLSNTGGHKPMFAPVLE